MSTTLKNKVAVITGGNSGIGLATAKLFVEEGAKVFITGRDQKTLDSALKELGPNAQGLVSDAGDLTAIAKLADTIRALHPKVDTLFLNAGIGKFAPFEETTEALFEETFRTNVKGPFFLTQKLLPVLGVGSSIVINASIVAHTGLPNTAAYSASKAAVLNFTKTLSAELTPRGIRVNAVSPGPISTPIFGKNGQSEKEINETKDAMKSMVPMGRLGLPEEIARTVLFLGSDQSSFVVGTEIIVDGGTL